MRIQNSLSDSLTIKHGVPQGSILGPLLFNIYINDLPSVCQNCNIKSYVDDSKLYVSFSNKDVNGGLDKLRQDLSRVASWCCENRFLINPGKNEFCVFGSNRMLTQTSIRTTGYIKKMVIELWSGLVRSLYNAQKSFFHSRKDQAFSFRMSPFL